MSEKNFDSSPKGHKRSVAGLYLIFRFADFKIPHLTSFVRDEGDLYPLFTSSYPKKESWDLAREAFCEAANRKYALS